MRPVVPCWSGCRRSSAGAKLFQSVAQDLQLFQGVWRMVCVRPGIGCRCSLSTIRRSAVAQKWPGLPGMNLRAVMMSRGGELTCPLAVPLGR